MVTSVSDTEVIVVVPAGTGAVEVSVTTPQGVADDLVYAYRPVPMITRVSPVSGPVSGGTAVTIAGTNLTTVSGVAFDGLPPGSKSSTIPPWPR